MKQLKMIGTASITNMKKPEESKYCVLVNNLPKQKS